MIRFHEAVDVATRVLKERFPGGLEEVTLVRDATGTLFAVLPNDALAPTEWDTLAARLHHDLMPFSAGPERVLLRRSDLIDPEDVLGSPDRVRLPENDGLHLVDRLLTNQDWLRQPLTTAPRVPLATAFSIKGGVGRSTAVAVWAWHLARQGRRVLVVDLDLEAPGVGSLLLSERPDYGLIDWLVEALVNGATPDLLDDIIASSPVGDDSPGVVRVIPALGAKTRDYVAQIGRVYMPSMDPSGQLHGIAHRLNALVEQVSERPEPPEIILLDARAGLHDIGAAAVTQLGAEVFLFARDDRQTWDAYRQLFQHLRLCRGVRWGMPDDDLRWRLKMVTAQADKREISLDRARDASYELWAELYDGERSDDDKSSDADRARAGELTAPQLFARDETEAPHYPLPIFFDAALQGMHLFDSEQRPAFRALEAAFGAFLDGATARVLPSGDTESEDNPP